MAFAQFEDPECPGCVSNSELSFVVSKLGFPFTLEDHAKAIEDIDTENFGKIHLVN